VTLVVKDLMKGVVLMMEGLGLSEIDPSVPVHLLVQHVQLVTVLSDLMVQMDGRGVHEDHFLLFDDVVVGDTVLLVVHVLALNGTLFLI
jgi:hypothetical protein